MSLNSTIELADGNKIPALGLGVWKTRSGKDCENAVRAALDFGYRHIDTARIYGNEADVGRAVKESGIDREKIFITTKLWNTDQSNAASALEKSLSALDTDYIDLFLIHFPVQKSRQLAWESLEQLKATGKIRSIGVSNYTISHLQELKGYAKEMPVVNQVEFHPYLFQKDLLAKCQAEKIVLEAYSPLAHGEKLQDKTLHQLADSLGKTPAQVLIRWSLQHGNIVIPKSSNPERIRQNGSVFDFELDTATMATIDAWNEDLRTCWDPTNA